MHYLIYKITNRLDNKFYVGKHKTENRDDDYFGSGLLLGRAVEKHGKENFVKEILVECQTEEEMNQKEADIVDEDFIARDDTYNIMLGGQGGWKHINESGRNKYIGLGNQTHGLQNLLHGDALKSKLIAGGRWEEYKKNISDGVKSTIRKKGTFHWAGRKHREDSKLKIGSAAKIHQSGTRNSQYGSHIFYNGETGEVRRFMMGEDVPLNWISAKDRRKLIRRQKKTQCISPKVFRAKNLHDEYLRSGCKSIREFCRMGHYNKTIQSLIMMWKKYIPDVYCPKKGVSYK
jgi:hypothetical protein